MSKIQYIRVLFTCELRILIIHMTDVVSLRRSDPWLCAPVERVTPWCFPRTLAVLDQPFVFHSNGQANKFKQRDSESTVWWDGIKPDWRSSSGIFE